MVPSGLEDVAADFAAHLGAFLAVVVIEELSRSIAGDTADRRRHMRRVLLAAHRLDWLAVCAQVCFEELFVIGRGPLALRRWTLGQRRFRIDIVLSIVGVFETEGVFAFDVGSFIVEDF